MPVFVRTRCFYVSLSFFHVMFSVFFIGRPLHSTKSQVRGGLPIGSVFLLVDHGNLQIPTHRDKWYIGKLCKKYSVRALNSTWFIKLYVHMIQQKTKNQHSWNSSDTIKFQLTNKYVSLNVEQNVIIPFNTNVFTVSFE